MPARAICYLWLLLALGCSPPEPLSKVPSSPPSPEPTRPAFPKPVSPQPVSTVSAASSPRPASPRPAPLVPAPAPSPSSPPSEADPAVALQPAPKSSLALTLPGPTRVEKPDNPQLAALLSQAEASDMAADWRKAGEKALALEQYPLVVRAFQREAGIYRSKGLPQAALAQQARAAQYATELSLYLSGPPIKRRQLERLEPESGCFVGAFIDRDDNLRQFMKASQTHGDVDQFNELTRKAHASFFMYRSYGQPFPVEWARYLKAREAIVHIAWEPRDLDQVRDDEYLRGFVDDLISLDHPVILRFASEMNGEWTPYHGNPERYKQAFRLVYQATRRAPKVAMLWCPNTIPRQGLESYYPGDDAVDWVGVNFYSVPFLDNDRARPGDKIHPTDHLQAVYDLYSARKPIAIGEWAASRESKASPEPLTEFAKTKISQLYSSLPTRYPRVKLVSWYDSNNLREATPSRQLNNYQVTSPPDLLGQYRKAIASPYYLAAGQSGSGLAYRPVTGRTAITSRSELRVSLKTYEQRPKVYFRVNGTLRLATAEALDWRLAADMWQPGKNVVEVFVFDRKNRFVASAKAVLDLSAKV